jgi:hypothetical protein
VLTAHHYNMAPPVTSFAIKDPYKYLEGFGNYHSYDPQCR